MTGRSMARAVQFARGAGGAVQCVGQRVGQCAVKCAVQHTLQCSTVCRRFVGEGRCRACGRCGTACGTVCGAVCSTVYGRCVGEGAARAVRAAHTGCAANGRAGSIRQRSQHGHSAPAVRTGRATYVMQTCEFLAPWTSEGPMPDSDQSQLQRSQKMCDMRGAARGLTCECMWVTQGVCSIGQDVWIGAFVLLHATSLPPACCLAETVRAHLPGVISDNVRHKCALMCSGVQDVGGVEGVEGAAVAGGGVALKVVLADARHEGALRHHDVPSVVAARHGRRTLSVWPVITRHNTTQHNTTQHNTTQHNTTQHNGTGGTAWEATSGDGKDPGRCASMVSGGMHSVGQCRNRRSAAGGIQQAECSRRAQQAGCSRRRATRVASSRRDTAGVAGRRVHADEASAGTRGVAVRRVKLREESRKWVRGRFKAILKNEGMRGMRE
eukprot:353931-Chlamydomonas_euryale.AAC.3